MERRYVSDGSELTDATPACIPPIDSSGAYSPEDATDLTRIGERSRPHGADDDGLGHAARAQWHEHRRIGVAGPFGTTRPFGARKRPGDIGASGPFRPRPRIPRDGLVVQSENPDQRPQHRCPPIRERRQNGVDSQYTRPAQPPPARGYPISLWLVIDYPYGREPKRRNAYAPRPR